jgi:hypothetical protein
MAPKTIRIPITRVFQRETPIICLQTVAERSEAFFLNGLPLITDGSGGSVDRASAAKVSIIKLIQSSCTGEIGDSANVQIPMKIVARIEMLTVI